MDLRDAIELRLLRSFLALAEELNFGRAAARLHLTQPALSAQLRQLEDRLGLKLFERTTRRVALTDQGQSLLPAARTLVGESQRFAEAAAALRGEAPRPVVLGAAFYTLEIPQRVALIEGFFARHPETRFEVTPLWQRELAHALSTGGVDLALFIGAPASRQEIEAEAGVEIYIPETLPRMVLREESAGLLVPRESPLAACEAVPPGALADMPVAMLGPAHGRKVIDPIQALLRSAGARPVVPPEPHGIGVERYGRQFRMPALTLGWFNTGGEDDPDMVRRRLEGLELVTQLALVRSPKSVSDGARLFWEEARSQFPEAALYNA